MGNSLLDGSTKHEVVLFELRGGLSDLCHLPVDTVYSFAEFADILILMKHLCNLWIAGEMSGTQIANPHHAREDA